MLLQTVQRELRFVVYKDLQRLHISSLFQERK